MKTDDSCNSKDLTKEIKDIAEGPFIDVAEVGLDTFLNEGVFKNLPVLSIANGVFKASAAVKRHFQINSLTQFVNGMNAGIVDVARKEEIRQRLLDDDKQTAKELEYILVLIDNYFDEEKSRLLAVFYLAYLDGMLDWEEFVVCSKIIDDLFVKDILLIKSNGGTRSDVYQRLVSKGLIRSDMGSQLNPRTRLGDQFLRCLLSYPEIVSPIEESVFRREVQRHKQSQKKMDNC